MKRGILALFHLMSQPPEQIGWEEGEWIDKFSPWQHYCHNLSISLNKSIRPSWRLA